MSGSSTESKSRRGGSLVVSMLAVSSIQPDLRNPRQHSDKHVRQIAKSIEAFGFNVPLLIDGENKLVAGHGRLMAVKHLGWTEVPCIRLEHLTPDQAKAFLIADNRLTDISTWDEKLLTEQLKELADVELDFDIEAIGFDLPEIDLRIQGLDEAIDEAEEVELPATDAIAITRPGDLWQLGPHRILCGDALDPASYDQLLEGAKASLVFTDPPYNVPIAGHVSGNGTIRHREFEMASGEMDEAAFTQFLSQICDLLAQNSTSGSLHYICMDWRHLRELLTAGARAYSELKNLCVWVKDNGGMGSFYRSQHELVLIYKNGIEPHVNNVQLGTYGRYRTNVWKYAGVNSFARATEEGNLLEMHPTVKPLKLVADALMDASHRKDRVLDPFLGSGTTLIAAETTGRVAYGLELDPLYVDTAIHRWQRRTGEAARRAGDGVAFADAEQAISGQGVAA
jgi:DNA modification methylase